ncbi:MULTISPECIES: hypothetical protein [Burkholderia]|uniref:Uncharacterized protein n=1 Tax=Burkholderia aenigmatica TaxID=2015348 RepID=A0A6J5JLL7_9BURK|nr:MULTISPECIES: hypothetical protein [Burkholderia]CAB3972318.1 hypothetical protein BLA3211_06908 [Burkholderia aenigmatica]
MVPEIVLAVIRSFANDETIDPPAAVLDLIHVLARSHATMDNDDWEVIAVAGGVLWRATMGDVEATADSYAALMRRLGK